MLTLLDQEWREYLRGCLDNNSIAKLLNITPSMKDTEQICGWEMPNRLLIHKPALAQPDAKLMVRNRLIEDRMGFLTDQVIKLKREWVPFKISILTHNTPKGLVVYWQSVEAFIDNRIS